MAEHIKIGDLSPRIQYVGDGIETSFTYPFPIFEESDLGVYCDGILQTLAVDYTTTGAGDSAGGTVTFLSAPNTGEVVTLVRDIVVKRTTDFQESGEFRASVINDELDKIIAIIQEITTAISRTVHLATTDDTGDMILPGRQSRANTYLAFDSNGEPLSAIDAGSYPATPFMATVLDDTDASTARSTLGALAPDGDGSGLTGIAVGGPSIGGDSLYRTNAKNTRADVTIADHTTTFTADSTANTLDVGTDDGFLDGDPVYLTTTGTLPAGLSASTEYYVVSVAAATLQLAATYGGSVIDITDTGAGTHTIYEAINAITAGPNTIESGVTVTVPEGSTLTVIGEGVPKAWGNLNQTTPALRDSLNLSSLTDNGAGDFTWNITNAMSDANYGITTGSNNSSSSSDRGDNTIALYPATTFTASLYRTINFQHNGSAVDCFVTCTTAIGDLA